MWNILILPLSLCAFSDVRGGVGGRYIVGFPVMGIVSLMIITTVEGEAGGGC